MKTTIPERKVVERNGGKVVIIPYMEGFSTTEIINRIMAYKGEGLFAKKISGRSIGAQSLVYFFDKEYNFVDVMDYEQCEVFIHNISDEMEQL